MSDQWIQTYTGKKFYPTDPQPEMIRIEDIAHALGNMCRYGGHCKRFYSVAEHSVYVSQHVPIEKALTGLLHDAAEAYMQDMPRPFKPMFPNYRIIETNILSAIYQKFDVPMPCPEVKRIDDAILADEAPQVMFGPTADWDLPEPPLGITIGCWPPDEASARFMMRFDDLAFDVAVGDTEVVEG